MELERFFASVLKSTHGTTQNITIVWLIAVFSMLTGALLTLIVTTILFASNIAEYNDDSGGSERGENVAARGVSAELL